MTNLDQRVGTGGDVAQIELVHALRPHNMRNDGDKQFFLVALLVRVPEEEFAEDGNINQPGNASAAVDIVGVQQPSEQRYLAIAHAYIRGAFLLSDHRLVHARGTAKVLFADNAGNIHLKMHAHFVVTVDERLKRDVHAHVRVLEGVLHQPAHADSGNGRLRTAAGERNLRTDIKSRFSA